MPIIIDTNQLSQICGTTCLYPELLDGLRQKKIIMIYGGTKLNGEYKLHAQFIPLLIEFRRLGSAKNIPTADVDAQQAVLESSGSLKSDDPHIIALARVGGSRLLVTADANLIKDFKAKSLIDSSRGKIYNRRNHQALLVLAK